MCRALFGYDKQSNDLKVVSTGGKTWKECKNPRRSSALDGGFDELVDEVNGSKVQYAWCKVTDPNTNLPKFVLVNWVSVSCTQKGAPSLFLLAVRRRSAEFATGRVSETRSRRGVVFTRTWVPVPSIFAFPLDSAF